MLEEWKDIIGYEGLYQVSNYGNIKSFHNRYYKINPSGILKPVILNTGYLNVSLINKNKERKEHRIHRLVAEAFIPNIDSKPQVNHKDNNRQNNLYSNLEWVSCQENLIHAQKQGRLFLSQSKGGKHSWDKRNLLNLDFVNSLIGKQYRNWTILKNLGIIKNPNAKKDNRPCLFVLAKCTCGNIKAVKFTMLQHEKNKSCNKCKGKLISLTKNSSK
jgi:hypothetical protein